MREETLRRVEKAIEAVKASKDGCGQVVIEVVKGRVTHIRNSFIEAVCDDSGQKPKTEN